ncbi:SHOCT domain-containing protein [Uliginosibacterium sediminicola]|uniref:SHOCT domain-containing protein n=1 Tax=Uliginosibacterium sediminicola TaxID=2024550 RepID=A0ABU9YY63_9RHOO
MQNKLQELKDLHEKGLITDEVYAEQQRVIVSSLIGAAENQEAPSQAATQGVIKAERPLWQQLLMSAFVVSAGVWILYQFSDQRGKDTINQIASHTGLGAQIIPWPDRADTVLRNLIPQNQQLLARSVQSIAHPTGTEPQFERFTVTKLNDQVQVEFVIAWKGGFVGNSYETTVLWEIDKNSHIAARVTSDSAMTEIDSRHKEVLDDFFRTKVYPSFYKGISSS